MTDEVCAKSTIALGVGIGDGYFIIEVLTHVTRGAIDQRDTEKVVYLTLKMNSNYISSNYSNDSNFISSIYFNSMLFLLFRYP